jgi:hypothetical protein
MVTLLGVLSVASASYEIVSLVSVVIFFEMILI